MDPQKISLISGIIVFVILSGILIWYVYKKDTKPTEQISDEQQPPIITKENCINRSSCINTGSFLDGAGDGPKNCRCGYPRKPAWK